MRRAVAAAFERATGKRAHHVRPIERGMLLGCYATADATPCGGRHATRPMLRWRFLVYWHAGAPSGWFDIPLTRAVCGQRRGTVRREVRNWLTRNVRRGAAKVVERWEMQPAGHGIARPAVSFEDQEDAALFRLSWL